DDILERVARLAQRRGDGLDADRPAAEAFGEQLQIAAVEGVEAPVVDFEAGERGIGDLRIDDRVAGDRGNVAHALQQAAGDARRAAGAAGDLARAVGREVKAQDARAAFHNGEQLLRRIEVEPDRNSETVAQRRGDETRPRRGTDQREGIE